MHRALKRLVNIMVATALAGYTFGAAALDAAHAAEPCPSAYATIHDIHGMPDGHSAHEGHHHGNKPGGKMADDCFKCCFVCQLAPTLALGQVAAVAVIVGAPTLYWADTTPLSGRSIRPDPAPPRP